MSYETNLETYGMDYFNQNNKAYVVRLKNKAKELFGNKCQNCGYNKGRYALCFHHIDESTKLFNISMFYSHKNKVGSVPKSIKLFAEEVSKCLLLCNNCHSEVHEGILDTSNLQRLNLTEDDFRIRRKKNTDGIPLKRLKKEYTKTCIGCITKISNQATMCKSCSDKSRINTNTKIDWPDLETLEKMIQESNYLQVGKKLGVSDNAVRKHIKKQKTE